MPVCDFLSCPVLSLGEKETSPLADRRYKQFYRTKAFNPVDYTNFSDRIKPVTEKKPAEVSIAANSLNSMLQNKI